MQSKGAPAFHAGKITAIYLKPSRLQYGEGAFSSPIATTNLNIRITGRFLVSFFFPFSFSKHIFLSCIAAIYNKLYNKLYDQEFRKYSSDPLERRYKRL